MLAFNELGEITSICEDSTTFRGFCPSLACGFIFGAIVFAQLILIYLAHHKVIHILSVILSSHFR